MLMKSIVVFTPILLLGLIAGCGSDMPKTVKVSGKVTFDGKAPPGPGVVYFLPQEAAKDFPLRPATGDFTADGAYKATTFAANDGLMPGKYKAYIECWETAPNMDGKPVKSFVPKKYQSVDSSGFELEVTVADRSKQQDFAVITK